MATVHQMIGATQRVDPVRGPNLVVETEKTPEGGLRCRQASGNEFTIPAGDEQMQAFVVWTMIHGNSMDRF